MSIRSHWTDASNLRVSGLNDDEMAELFDGWAITQADVHLFIEDPGNQEAWIIDGDRNDLKQFCLRAYDSVCEQPRGIDLDHFCWRERTSDGRLLVPRRDPMQYENPVDFIFATAEEAIDWRDEDGGDDDDPSTWVLVHYVGTEVPS